MKKVKEMNKLFFLKFSQNLKIYSSRIGAIIKAPMNNSVNVRSSLTDSTNNFMLKVFSVMYIHKLVVHL